MNFVVFVWFIPITVWNVLNGCSALSRLHGRLVFVHLRILVRWHMSMNLIYVENGGRGTWAVNWSKPEGEDGFSLSPEMQLQQYLSSALLFQPKPMLHFVFAWWNLDVGRLLQLLGTRFCWQIFIPWSSLFPDTKCFIKQKLLILYIILILYFNLFENVTQLLTLFKRDLSHSRSTFSI